MHYILQIAYKTSMLAL